MYHISLYFDEESNKKIENYIKKVSEYSENDFMINHHIPVHMTLLSFHADNEEEVLKILKKHIEYITSNTIYFVSFGVFLPYVIHVTPVLNHYLSDMSSFLYNKLKNINHISFMEYYKPYNWFPHVTVGKTLNQEQMKKSFLVLQNEFKPFHAKITTIALSKTNPYTDIIRFSLKENNK